MPILIEGFRLLNPDIIGLSLDEQISMGFALYAVRDNQGKIATGHSFHEAHINYTLDVLDKEPKRSS